MIKLSHILPRILATITRHDRQQVIAGRDFEWSEKSWTHNSFRAYEILFGRREGICAEMSAWNEGKKTYYQCHSWESVFALVESRIRGVFKWRLPVRVFIPIFVPAGMGGLMPSPYLFAIAVDNHSSSTGAGGTSNTISSFAISGSSTLLLGHAVPVTGTGVTSFTWNGSSTGFASVTGSANQTNNDASNMAQYAIVGVSGTHDIVGNWGNAAFGIIIGTSYSGVNQSNTPDSFTTNSTVNAHPKTATTTVVAANCWLFLTNYSDNAAATAGTGAFLRQQGNNVTIAAFDSNGTVGTGSQSMTITTGGGAANFAYIMSSFKPSPVTTNGNFLMFF